MSTTLDDILRKVLEVEELVRNLPNNLRVITADQIITDSLSAITANIGVLTAGVIKSPNYVTGASGFYIDATSGNAEFQNIVARGYIGASVLVYNERHCVSGKLNVTYSAGKVRTDFTTPSAVSGTVAVDIDDPPSGHAQLFLVNDVVLIQAGGTSAWFTVNAASDQTTFYRYTLELESGSTSAKVYKGTVVADFGPNTGSGYLEMVAKISENEGPYYSVRTHAGLPWSSVSEVARLGNMRNAYGTGANDRYGIGLGNYSSGNYMSFNAASANEFILSAGDGSVKISAGGIRFYAYQQVGSSPKTDLYWYRDAGGGGDLISRMEIGYGIDPFEPYNETQAVSWYVDSDDTADFSIGAYSAYGVGGDEGMAVIHMIAADYPSLRQAIEFKDIDSVFMIAGTPGGLSPSRALHFPVSGWGGPHPHIRADALDRMRTNVRWYSVGELRVDADSGGNAVVYSSVAGALGGFRVSDVHLYRSAADTWYTPDILEVGNMVRSKVDGVTGGFAAGSGLDVRLYRSAANTWYTSDAFTTSSTIHSLVNGSGGGFMAGADSDVHLYRSAVDFWYTPDSLGLGGDIYPQSAAAGLNSRFVKLFGANVPMHTHAYTKQTFQTNDFVNHKAGFEDNQSHPYSFGGSPGGFSITYQSGQSVVSSGHYMKLHPSGNAGALYLQWTSSTAKTSFTGIADLSIHASTNTGVLFEVRVWAVQSPGGSDNYWALRVNYYGGTTGEVKVGLWYGTGTTIAYNNGTLIGREMPCTLSPFWFSLSTGTESAWVSLTDVHQEGNFYTNSVGAGGWPSNAKTMRIYAPGNEVASYCSLGIDQVIIW